MRKIAPLLAMLLLCSALAFAQTRTITGQVKDDKGSPIPFATVTETRTNRAVTADANGSFTINVEQNARLNITATGYQAQEVSAANIANISLVRGEKQLDEVVVTA